MQTSSEEESIGSPESTVETNWRNLKALAPTIIANTKHSSPVWHINIKYHKTGSFLCFFLLDASCLPSKENFKTCKNARKMSIDIVSLRTTWRYGAELESLDKEVKITMITVYSALMEKVA